MKFVLTTLVMIVSVMAMADIPRPAVDPRPPKTIDAEAISALVYGTPEAKLKELKSGTNTMFVNKINVDKKTTEFIFTTRQCTYGKAGYLCLGGKQLKVTKTEISMPDRRSVKYKASEVMRLR